MFSRGRVCVLDKEGNEIESDPFLEKIANPNYSQSQDDFLYQHLFFKGLGNNITRIISRNKSKTADAIISMEHLVPTLINYKEINKVKKFTISKSDKDDIKGKHIEYNLDGKCIEIPLEQLVFFYDVANGLTQDSRFKSPSRITSLVPAIKNIEEAQKAKNINLNFSAKHIAAGKSVKDPNNPFSDITLSTNEKQEIETRLYNKDIHAIGGGLEVHSLANNMRELVYDEGVNAELLKIASAFGMGKDVLNWALSGASTHENKNTAIVDWIQNSIQFEADDFCNTFNNYLGYKKQGKTIAMKYDHLPVMQIIEQRRMDAMVKKIEIAEGLIRLGRTQQQALEEVGL